MWGDVREELMDMCLIPLRVDPELAQQVEHAAAELAVTAHLVLAGAGPQVGDLAGMADDQMGTAVPDLEVNAVGTEDVGRGVAIAGALLAARGAVGLPHFPCIAHVCTFT